MSHASDAVEMTSQNGASLLSLTNEPNFGGTGIKRDSSRMRKASPLGGGVIEP